MTRRRAPAVAVALVVAAVLGSCGGPRSPVPAASGRSRAGRVAPGPDRSALVKAIGQGCTWYGGLTVTVTSVTRRDRDAPRGRAGYVVAVRIANRTPKSFATGGLVVRLWSGAALAPATGDDRGALGGGLPDEVVSPRRQLTGAYGFTIGRRRAATDVAVGLSPDPVVQQCVLRGTAG